MSERVIYLPLRDVAKVCGLTEHTLLTRYWPAHWGVPRDWRLVGSSVIVNEASLPDLARELTEAGQAPTAALLNDWLAENAAQAQLEDFVVARVPQRQAAAAEAETPWFKKGQFE